MRPGIAGVVARLRLGTELLTTTQSSVSMLSITVDGKLPTRGSLVCKVDTSASDSLTSDMERSAPIDFERVRNRFDLVGDPAVGDVIFLLACQI